MTRATDRRAQPKQRPPPCYMANPVRSAPLALVARAVRRARPQQATRSRRAFLMQQISAQKRAQSEEDLKKISTIVSRDDTYYKERYESTMTLILQLPVNQREALMLHAEGYDYEEIAQKLNIAKGTVMSSLCRAREKLTELLMKSEDNE